MKFSMPESEIYVPDGLEAKEALERTTHLCISAHQDDIEIMALHGILECFGKPDKWFSGVVVTNGSGSPRSDLYADYSDEQMRQVRKVEQKKAAFVGEYAAQILLDYPSSDVKQPAHPMVVADLAKILETCKPEVLYVHNLADKHDTHIGVTLRTIEALRSLPIEARPRRMLGCEVWRDLDWMVDSDKVGLDVQAHPNLAMSLLGVFDSQISGGKRYDLASVGRRTAHATYFASHGVDDTSQLTFAMDLSPILRDDSLDVAEFVLDHIRRFEEDVQSRIAKFS